MPPLKYDWFTVIYTSLFFTGFLILLVVLTISGFKGISDASIAGYCAILVSMLLICAHMFNSVRTRGMQADGNWLTALGILFNNIGPFILNIAIISFTLYLLFKYNIIINAGHVPDQYTVFSKISISLVLMQIIIFFKGMRSTRYQEDRVLPLIYNTGSYFLSIVNIYIVIIMNTMLSLYTTDG